MTEFSRLPGFRGEFLWELEIATRQLLALAVAFPAEKYVWRPQPGARSVSEVFVHVATGNFMLLDVIGVPAPADLYAGIATEGQQRFLDFIRTNDELVATMSDKQEILSLLKRCLEHLQEAMTQTSDVELERPLFFFGEKTTVRRAYLRLLTHTHEHMGQMITYLRFNGIAVPWRDWRPNLH